VRAAGVDARADKDHESCRDEARALMRLIQDKAIEYDPDRKVCTRRSPPGAPLTRAQLSIVVEFIAGKVTDTIDRLTALYRPDALVVGTRGQKSMIQSWGAAFGGASFGSVSKYCLSRSPVPIIVVRPEAKVRKTLDKRRADPKRGKHFDEWVRSSEVQAPELTRKQLDQDADESRAAIWGRRERHPDGLDAHAMTRHASQPAWTLPTASHPGTFRAPASRPRAVYYTPNILNSAVSLLHIATTLFHIQHALAVYSRDPAPPYSLSPAWRTASCPRSPLSCAGGSPRLVSCLGVSTARSAPIGSSRVRPRSIASMSTSFESVCVLAENDASDCRAAVSTLAGGE
jgi:nucleotide-binding universal stress UspA family protein